MPWFHQKKTNGQQIRHVWGAMLGRYQKYNQHCRAEDCLAIDME